MTARLASGEDGEHVTFCRICEAQCGLVADVRGGLIRKIGPDRHHPVSRGHLCVKGPGMMHVAYDPDRLLTPQKRVGAAGQFEPVGWDQALDDISRRLADIIEEHGGDAVGFYVGNPAAFATQHMGYASRFASAIGSTKFFTAVHADTASKHVACEMIYGHPFRIAFPDLSRCEFLLILGANPLVSHFSLVAEPRALERLQAIAEKGGVVVVDPRLTETARRFEHVPIIPDTDQWLLLGIIRVLFDEGLTRPEAELDLKVIGWRDLKRAVTDFDLARAEHICGIPDAMVRKLARRLAATRAAACYGRIGTSRGRFTTLTNILIEAVNLLTGHFGAPGGSVLSRTPFEQESGTAPPPAYGHSRSRIGNFPSVMGMLPGGTLSAEIMSPGPGQLQALFVDCGNPVMSYPGGDHTARALDQLKLQVSIDFFVTETSRHAHYILPPTTFLERADCTEKFVTHAPSPWLQFTDAVIPPRGEARHEYDIYDGLRKRLHLPPLYAAYSTSADPSPNHLEVADLLLRNGYLGDGFGARPQGFSLQRLQDEFPHGVQHREFVDAQASWQLIAHQDKKPHLWGPLIERELERLLEERQDGNGTLKLFGRRYLRSINSWMHSSEELVRSDRPVLLMHPDDARERSIADGTTVMVSAQAGSVELEVEITTDVIPGSVSYPHGWGHRRGSAFVDSLPGADINLIASSRPEDWEQVSGTVHLDGICVTVSPILDGGRERGNPIAESPFGQ